MTFPDKLHTYTAWITLAKHIICQRPDTVRTNNVKTANLDSTLAAHPYVIFFFLNSVLEYA